MKKLFEDVAGEFGGLDVLINNAGVYSFGPLEWVTETEFHRQYNSNVLGTLLATQEAVFLSSEASSWVTGEILLASGGMRWKFKRPSFWRTKITNSDGCRVRGND